MVARLNRKFAAVLAGVAVSLVWPAQAAFAQETPIIVRGPNRDALRGPDREAFIKRVAYRDLNLASYAGERKLVTRVGSAVRKVCRDDDDHAYGNAQSDYHNCTAIAWGSARPQMIGAVYRARQLAYYRR